MKKIKEKENLGKRGEISFFRKKFFLSSLFSLLLLILFISFGISISAGNVFAVQAFPTGTTDLRTQACNEGNTVNMTMNQVCAGVYPSACSATGDFISCNDAFNESTSTTSNNGYLGVNISAFNSTISDCLAIQQVFLCYSRWSSSANIGECTIAVDNNNGASYVNINNTCPGTTANPATVCTNVTASKTWACSNFFGASGTRALARMQVVTTSGGSKTFFTNALFFNVSYSVNTIPVINITYPFNITYNINISTLNYTVSSSALGSCWYSLNSGTTNTTITCGTNLTGLTSTEGSNTWKIWANDTSNNANVSSVTFFKDTIKPQINLTYPLNTTYTTNITALNYTVSDTNLQACWYSLNSGTTNTTITCGTNLTGLTSTEGSNTWKVWANDTSNNANVSSITFFKDTINPAINFSSPSETSGSTINRRYILVNVTASDGGSGLKNITINLYNSTRVLINSSNSTGSPLYVNFSVNADGLYFFNATTYDISGNVNYTETRNVTVDTTYPLLVINSPNDGINITANSLLFSFNVTDLFSATMNCSLILNSIINKTNSSVLNGTVTTFNVTGLSHGTYIWNISCTDQVGWTNITATRNFFVNQTPYIAWINVTPITVKGGSSVTLNASGMGDPNNDTLNFYCGNNFIPNTTNYNCTTSVTSSNYNATCSFNSPTTDTTYVVYCRANDGIYYSNNVSVNYTTDSTVPITSIVAVANDATQPYVDLNNTLTTTNISISGESGMLCRWYTTDSAYSAGSGTACIVSGANANCTITYSPSKSEGLYTRYVSCADSLGNGQNASQNLDVQYYVDYNSPTATDNATSGYKLPGYNVLLTVNDNVDPSPLMYYCSSITAGCNPTTSITNGTSISFSTRGTNYLRYYSVDFAGNTQSIVNKSINISQLPIFTSAVDNATIIKGGSYVNVSTVSQSLDLQTLTLHVCNQSGATFSGCNSGTYCTATGIANLSCVLQSEIDDNNHTWYAYLYNSLNENATTNPLTGIYQTVSTGPVITIVNPTNNTSYNTSSLTFQITTNKAPATVWFSLNSGSSNTTMLNTTATSWYYDILLNQTTYNAIFYSNDSYTNYGNASYVTFTITSAVDTVPPTITIVSPANNSYNVATSVLINITTDKNASWAGYSLNNGAVVALGNYSLTNWDITLSLNEESRYNLTIFANSTSNYQSNKSSVFLTDSLAPRYSNVQAYPANINLSQQVNCSIFWNDTFNITNVIISENSLGSYENHSITFSGSNGNASYTIAASRLANPGTYTCLFYASDAAGNTNSTNTTFTVRDQIAPIVYPNSPSNDATYANGNVSAIISLSKTGFAAWYSLSNAANVSMSNTSATSWNATLLNLANGAYTIIYYANDSSGNLGNSSIISFNVNTASADTTPPIILVDTIANGSYKNSTTVYLNVTGSENLNWSGYILNSGSLVSMSNSTPTKWNATLSGLTAESTNTLLIYANDSVATPNMGNTNITFYVDTIAPRFLNVTASPAVANETQSVICNAYVNDTFGFTVGSVKIGENSSIPGVWQNHTIDLTSKGWMNYTITNVQKGGFNCLFYATDLAGNSNSTNVGFVVNDVTPPTISINSPLNITYNVRTILFSISLNENASHANYSLDGGVTNVSLSGSAKTWSNTVTLSSDGSKTLTYYAIDNSGNLGTNNVTFYIDTSVNDVTPPTITVLSPINNTYYSVASILLNISTNKDLSWAGYVLDSGSLTNLGNASLRNWNKTITLTEGQHNITFLANDTTTNKNQGSIVYTIYTDLNNPSGTIGCRTPVNVSDSVICSLNVSDSLGLNYYVIGSNGSDGTWRNSSVISVSSGNLNSFNTTYNLSGGNSSIPGFSVEVYVYDLSGRFAKGTENVVVNDNIVPGIYNITYIPNTTAGLKPGVRINFSVDITDNYRAGVVLLLYKNSSVSDWNSIIMSNTTFTNYNVSLVFNNETWQFKISANDSYNNQNISSATTLNIFNISSQNITTDIPAIKSLTYAQESGSTNLGTVSLNNNGDFNLNITVIMNSGALDGRLSVNLTSNYTMNYSANVGTITNITLEVNTTTLPTGVYDYTFTVTSIAGTSIFSKQLLVQSAIGPYLSVIITDYSSSVTAGQTGINFSANVQNLGTGTANSGFLNWSLPSEFSISNGQQNIALSTIPVGVTYTNPVTIGVDSAAASKTVYIYAISGSSELSVLNASKAIAITTITPTTIVTPGAVVSTGGGGGGGGGGAGAGSKNVVLFYKKDVELVRGQSDEFTIDISNIYQTAILKDLRLNLTGYLSQYISISPSVIDTIGPKQKKSFKIRLKAPAYKGFEQYLLNATIEGKIVLDDGVTKDYTEKQSIKLTIQEVAKQEVTISLKEAEDALLFMNSSGFGTRRINELLSKAKLKLKEGKNKEALDLANEAVKIKESAERANKLISIVKEALDNPRKDYLLFTTFAIKDVPVVNYASNNNNQNNALDLSFGYTGSGSEQSAADVLNLAIAAFYREDFELAEQRAKTAQTLLILERKGNVGLFLFLYWPYILLGLAILLILGFIIFKIYRKNNISRKIVEINKEEANIKELIIKNQENYYNGNISMHNFQNVKEQYLKSLAKIRNERLMLRNKRVKILSEEQVLKDLFNERKEVEFEIKKLQEKYYVKKEISKAEYKIWFDLLNVRLAEIEDEELTVNVSEGNKKYLIGKKEIKNRKETNDSGVLNFFKNLFKNNRRENKHAR